MTRPSRKASGEICNEGGDSFNAGEMYAETRLSDHIHSFYRDNEASRVEH